jgi:hypothetical protein
MKPSDVALAQTLLKNRDNRMVQILYETWFNEPMPGLEEEKVLAKIIPFPKRISPGLRRKILDDAMENLE